MGAGEDQAGFSGSWPWILAPLPLQGQPQLWNLGHTHGVCDIPGLLEPGFMLPIQVCVLGLLYTELLFEPCPVSSLPSRTAFTSASVLWLQLCLLSGSFPSLSISLTWFQSCLL